MPSTAPARPRPHQQETPAKPRRRRFFSTSSPRRAAFFLALVSLIVFNANLRVISAGDTLPARLIPFSILLDGTVTLDRFYRHPPPGQRAPYFLRQSGDKLYSAYPVTLPVLATPLYAPMVWGKGDWTNREILHVAADAEKVTASLIAAASVAVMYMLLVALADRRAALILTAAFAFGTTTWTASSQALWQHGAGVLFILLTLAVLVRRPHLLWLAGTFAGLAVAVRPTNLFFWLAVLLVCGRTRPARALSLALPGVAIGGAVAAYNLLVFGDLRGGYAPHGDLFTSTVWSGLTGSLVSPSRGLLVYSPVLLAGFAGLWIAWRERKLWSSPVLAISALFLASQLVCVAAWGVWWGGWSYGPRLLTEAAAVLVVLAVPAFEWLRSRRWARVAFGASLAYSVGVQALGAFAYDTVGGWNQYPVNVDKAPGRLWDWRDTQIRRTVTILLHGSEAGRSPGGRKRPAARR